MILDPLRAARPTPAAHGAAAAIAIVVWLVTTAAVVSAGMRAAVGPGSGSGPTAAASQASAPLYAEGAPAGFSGGYGEPSCHACHFEADVNLKPGSLTITGTPARFVPGQRYPLTVTLTRPGMTMGGFQLTARFTDGGAQAGMLEPDRDEAAGVGVDRRGEIVYVNHRRQGTKPVALDTARWTVLWTAPTAAAPVRFHVAANAADGDESVSGDYVYTAELETEPAAR